MQCSNHLSIGEFKSLYITKLGDGGEGLIPEKMRLFCLGKELKDEFFLYTYDIIDDMTVQVMLLK